MAASAATPSAVALLSHLLGPGVLSSQLAPGLPLALAAAAGAACAAAGTAATALSAVTLPASLGFITVCTPQGAQTAQLAHHRAQRVHPGTVRYWPGCRVCAWQLCCSALRACYGAHGASSACIDSPGWPNQGLESCVAPSAPSTSRRCSGVSLITEAVLYDGLVVLYQSESGNHACLIWHWSISGLTAAPGHSVLSQ